MRKLLTAALILTMAMAATVRAMQTDNHGIHPVPAPRGLKIDGGLSDWDLSGSVLICYDVESLKDVYSGRVAMMYDEKAFYVAIHWKDPIPMGNSHDPRFQAQRGWAGDCVQLRIKTDRICHVTAWYYAAGKAPFIHIDYGKDLTHPFGGGSRQLARTQGWKLEDGAEMAFVKDADGKGYVQEIKLPWSLITLDKNHYVAGERFRCGIELLWGEADWPVHRYADNLADGATSREFFWTAHQAWGDVILEEKGGLTLPVPPWEKALAEEKAEGPIKIAYTLPNDARVTIAIDDAQGRRVRNLLAAAERKKGPNVDLWDGLDDAGEVVKPGAYRVKGLYHDTLHVKYATSFASPGKPGWQTADGTGAYYGDHTPPEAVAAGADRLALACPMGEAGQHLIGVDMNGHRRWGLANRATFGGGRISLATDGKILFVANVDARNGRFTIWRCDLKTGRYAPWTRTGPDGKAVLDLEIMPRDGMANLRAVAWHDGRLALILAGERRLLLIDAKRGDLLKDWKHKPAGMSACAFSADGTLLLAAGATLFSVSTTDGSLKKIADGLDDPRGIACDAQGRIYVSQRGAKQNVEVFDATGRKVGHVGKPGGRPERGFFDPAGMREPAQIAIDSKGRLWVTESTREPKRTSVWNPDGGLAFDLIGTTGYAEGGIINPFDHTRAFSERVEYKLDYAKQTFRPLFSLPDALGTGVGWITKIVRVGGVEYAQARSSARDAGMVKLFTRNKDGAWQHVAEWGNVGAGRSLDEKYHARWNAKFKAPLWQGLFGRAFLWVDRNGDGQAQREEIQTRPDVQFGLYYWGQAVGEDLTVVVPDRKSGAFLVFKPQGANAAGVPLFSFDNVRTNKPACQLGGEGMMAVGRGDRIYLNQSPLTALDSAGKVQWTYPSHYVSVHGSHRAPAAQSGLLIGPSSFYGTAWISKEIGEIFYLNGNLGQNFIFTEDGLWVQSLYNDCRGWFDVPSQATPGMPCDAMTAGGESFGGGFTRSDDGKFYTVGGGTAAIVMEVTGLNSLHRFGGALAATDTDIAAAQELKVRGAARKMVRKVYTIKRAAAVPPTDGTLDAWQMDKNAIEIQAGRNKVGTIKAVYDDKNLYLAYQVNDRSPLRNSGQDEKLMFITGDCVDLMLRTDPKATSPRPAKGDLRLLMTIKEGKPLAVLYRPLVPGTPRDKRVALSSPWRTAWFDAVDVATFPLTVKKARGGYVVVAAVPLRLLGVDSLKDKVLRGDFGILGSDSAGRECTSRNYWSNKTTNNTNDVPDEALLTPALWGELRFE